MKPAIRRSIVCMRPRSCVVRIASLLLAFPLFAVASPSDVNNPTGASGIIMIDKLGRIVRFFDPATLIETSTLTITGTPHELALSPDRRTAYVPDYGDGVYGRNPNPGHSIAVIDLKTRRLRDTIDIAPHVAPHGLQVDANGRLYATCDISRKLLVIDPQARKVVAAIDTDGTGHWVAVKPDGSKAYVANKNDRRFVSVIDLKAQRLVGKVEMPNGTQGITMSPDGKHVIALDLTAPTFAVIDTVDDRIVSRVHVTNATKGLWRARYSPDGRRLLVTSSNENAVHVLDAHDLEHGKQLTIATGRTPFGIAFSPDSQTALIGNHGDGTVDVLDLRALRIVGGFKAGTGIETLTYF